MALHKLARCCEALGKTEEALSALDRAERAKAVYPEREFALEICGLVRYRLTHEGYIHDPVYGEKLTRCFEPDGTGAAAGICRVAYPLYARLVYRKPDVQGRLPAAVPVPWL